MKIDLAELGIRDGIWEVIATTRSEEGIFNAAPIGLECREGRFSISLFRPSRTLENVLHSKRIGVNILHDPIVFVESATGNLDSSYFTILDDLPVIRNADFSVIFETRLFERGERYRFDLEPIAAHKNFEVTHPVNRGFNALIEALILVTRYYVVNKSEMADLLKGIEHYEGIVWKCGGKREREAMELLREHLRRLVG
ncbi:MAG: hypothetical protein SYNGOMJ08_00113 [Candidatus Syntrophoarchaeum sp. GoM_oil]|nr:MAG: hypothetical protein SYNGOMJ08_00113 [Candidatus Syntrophoarchaeum sp. GoM_oil]